MKRAKITFWGVRGSLPAPGRRTIRFGGNTACVELSFEDTLITCDAGTGIRPLGLNLIKRNGNKPTEAHIILSHLHWDHYIGLPFFKPLFNGKNRFVVAGPKAKGMGFAKALSGAMRPPYFPIPFSKIPARLSFKTLSTKPFRIGRVRVKPFAVNHPGGALGWRFYFPNGKSLVHVTDNEPKSLAHDKKFIAWMKGADVLIHDAQYSPADYARRHGWGHSPFTYPIYLACNAGIERVFLFHFDPEDDDKKLAGIRKEVKKLAKKYRKRLECDLAREGLSIFI